MAVVGGGRGAEDGSVASDGRVPPGLAIRWGSLF